MERLPLIFWRYWAVAVCAVTITGLGGVADAYVAPNAQYPTINIVMPEQDPQAPAPLVEMLPGELDSAPAPGQVGLASWYGHQEQGRPTANGERFDQRKLTAAHRTLPLPSHVRVTNLENGKSVVVRVNDRGPFIPGRVLDLSTGAAQALGMQKEGVALVRIVVLPG